MFLECNATATQLDMAHKAKVIRQRLQTPPNSVQDRPLSLKRQSRGITGLEARKIAQDAAAEARDNKRIAELEAQVEELKRRLAEKNNPVYNSGWFIHDGIRDYKFPQNYIKYIKQDVAKAFDVSMGDIDSVHRSKDLVIPRHVAMYLVKELLPQKSYPEIGRRFGKRDHTTALSAVRKMPRRMLADPWLCQTVVELQAKLEFDLDQWRAAS